MQQCTVKFGSADPRRVEGKGLANRFRSPAMSKDISKGSSDDKLGSKDKKPKGVEKALPPPPKPLTPLERE
jgi:hypothetical protein